MFVRSVASTSSTRLFRTVCSNCAIARRRTSASIRQPIIDFRQFSSIRDTKPGPSSSLSQRDFFTPHRSQLPETIPRRWNFALASVPIVVPVSAAAEYEPNFILGTLADLLVSSPLPSYGTTIILMTIILRSATTFPVALWQRKRMARMKSVVQPLADEYNTAIRKELAPECRQAGLSFRQFDAKAREKVNAYIKTLHKKYNTQPTITQWAPLTVHIPLLIVFSLVIRTAIDIPGSPLGVSSFLFIDKLSEPEFTMALAGGIMTAINSEITARSGERTVLRLEKTEEEQKEKIKAVVEKHKVRQQRVTQVAKSKSAKETTLMAGPRGNADSSIGSQSSALRLPRAPMRNTDQKATTSTNSSGKLSVPKVGQIGLGGVDRTKRSISTSAVQLIPNPFAKTANPAPQKEEYEREGMSASAQAAVRTDLMSIVMRGGSVGFVCIASLTPSAVSLYWLTSIAFSLVQNAYFNIYKPLPAVIGPPK